MNTIDTIRQFRIGEYAVFDFAISFLGVYLISPFLSKITKKIGFEISSKGWILLTAPFSILIHLLVGNRTAMTNDVLDPFGHYPIKIILLILLFLGISQIRRYKK